MKARYDNQPLPVTIKTLDDTNYIIIALNPVLKHESTEHGEYDYVEVDQNEIICPVGTLDLNELTANPERYLNYQYDPSMPTVAERVSDCELAIMELAEVVYG